MGKDPGHCLGLDFFPRVVLDDPHDNQGPSIFDPGNLSRTQLYLYKTYCTIIGARQI